MYKCIYICKYVYMYLCVYMYIYINKGYMIMNIYIYL